METKFDIMINGATSTDAAMFQIHFGTIPEVINLVYAPAKDAKKTGGMTKIAPKNEDSSAANMERVQITAEQSKATTAAKRTRRQRRRLAFKNKSTAMEAIHTVNQVPENQIFIIKTENSFAPLYMVRRNSSMVDGLRLKPVEIKRDCPELPKRGLTRKYSQKVYETYKRAIRALRTRSTRRTDAYDTHTIYMMQHVEESEVDPEVGALKNLAERVTAKGRKPAAIIREPTTKSKRSAATSSKLPEPAKEIEEEEEEEEEHVIFNPLFSAQDSAKDKTIDGLLKQLEKKDEDVHALTNKVTELTEALANMREMFIQQNQLSQRQASISVQPEETTISMSKREIHEMVAHQIRQAEITKSTPSKRQGRPYPPEIDSILYPPGYTVPNFRVFNGVGNPDQHLAHFTATCGNTGSNDALLLRQFSHSLSDIAFEWYYSLENNSIYTWTDMEEAFRTKFASASDSISIADLVNSKRRKDERMLDYFTRWRNLSIKCEQSLDEAQAVGLLIGNVDDWMAPFICTGNISTYKELFTQVGKLERMSPQVIASLQPPRYKREEPRRIDPRVAYTNDSSERRNREIYTVHIPRDDKRPQVSRAPMFGEGSNTQRGNITLKERKSKDYSFKKEKTMKIFKDALKNGLQLPEPRRPEEAAKTNEANYCPYHRILGHTIEECYVFQDWVEREYKAGRITLSKQVLKEPYI